MSELTAKSRRNKKGWKVLLEVFLVLLTVVMFLVPFYFILVNSAKTSQEAAFLNLEWPTEFQLWDNIVQVFQERNYMLVTAFINSTIITVVSIALLIVTGSMAAFVLNRRKGKASSGLYNLFMIGLMIPPAVVPTIWVLNQFNLFKTFPGIILVMVALQIPFTILIYNGFIATIPREIDEAAIIDGSDGLSLFFKIIFPMLKPVHSTIIILNSVTIFNDFVHPLYFFPGTENATVQLTLYNFMSMYNTDWNLLFANILLITLPPFILFLFFSERIVSGMTAGAVKG